jgi:hypothetical protein
MYNAQGLKLRCVLCPLFYATGMLMVFSNSPLVRILYSPQASSTKSLLFSSVLQWGTCYVQFVSCKHHNIEIMIRKEKRTFQTCTVLVLVLAGRSGEVKKDNGRSHLPPFPNSHSVIWNFFKKKVWVSCLNYYYLLFVVTLRRSPMTTRWRLKCRICWQ